MGADFRILDIQRSRADLRREIHALKPDGIITEALPNRTEMIVDLGFPTVIADTDFVFPGAVSIDVDDVAVGTEAARFFLAAGYLHFACVRNTMPYSDQRYTGFSNEIGKRAESFHTFQQRGKLRAYMESWNEESGTLSRWLAKLPKPVAVFAVHDPLGRMVCAAATAAGLQVPEEVAVVGANNDELVCGLSYPPLSSVGIPWDAVGTLAGEWVQRVIASHAPPKGPLLVQPGPVVARQSTTLVAVDDADLRRVIQHMRHRFAEGTGVGGICDTLHLSRRAVERKFAKFLQASPWEVLCRTRVDAARELLGSTDRRMSEIAEQCGFGNAEQFSVTFRRVTGTTPGSYRRSVRG